LLLPFAIKKEKNKRIKKRENYLSFSRSLSSKQYGRGKKFYDRKISFKNEIIKLKSFTKCSQPRISSEKINSLLKTFKKLHHGRKKFCSAETHLTSG
jgi:hypothetical protein